MKNRLDQDIKQLRLRTDEDKKEMLDRIGNMNQEINQAIQENRKKKDLMVLRSTQLDQQTMHLNQKCIDTAKAAKNSQVSFNAFE